MLKPGGSFSFATGSLSAAAAIGGGATGASFAAASLSAGRPISGEPGGSGAAAVDAGVAGAAAAGAGAAGAAAAGAGAGAGVAAGAAGEGDAAGAGVDGCCAAAASVNALIKAPASKARRADEQIMVKSPCVEVLVRAPVSDGGFPDFQSPIFSAPDAIGKHRASFFIPELPADQ